MIRLHNQTLRTFFHSVTVATVLALGLALGGHRTWAAGYALGALVSLFSLFSLKVCVPALFHRGATARATALLQALLVLKLPFYAVALYFAARMGAAAGFAAFAGCALVPAVITAEHLGRALVQANPRLARILAMRATVVGPETAEISGAEATAATPALVVHEGA
ncbi:MAG TPA: hypothetical protein VKT77_05095 [Chthonomonadaceae bacterium]|nr:hypothetical protein [Chthonomonadaceae bacterium]